MVKRNILGAILVFLFTQAMSFIFREGIKAWLSMVIPEPQVQSHYYLFTFILSLLFAVVFSIGYFAGAGTESRVKKSNK